MVAQLCAQLCYLCICVYAMSTQNSRHGVAHLSAAQNICVFVDTASCCSDLAYCVTCCYKCIDRTASLLYQRISLLTQFTPTRCCYWYCAATGVCTGLAWTREGGELLFIECSGVCDGGTGALTLTGKLGEVTRPLHYHHAEPSVYSMLV
jgi:Lon protease (S16) C-terminal proteolytic domain